MRSISEMSPEVAAKITTVFTDIDDTLTTDGRLPAAAYTALEQLFDAGLHVAAITGRPAGWCDMIARFWPLSGVVGENGAFYFAYDAKNQKMQREFFLPASDRRADRGKLDRILARILQEVPGSAVSADQAFRAADLAIDFCEDVPPLDHDAIARIKAIFEAEGAVAKISSIHVNGWFGAYDKLKMSRRFAADVLGFDLDEQKQRVVYCGDSPNDAEMFGFFPNACGVANVLDFRGQLDREPAWIASQRGGDGFVEIARALLEKRADAR